MQLSTLIFAFIAVFACWVGQTIAGTQIQSCKEYNPIQMTTQQTLSWRGYKNLLRQPGSANFAKDTLSFQQSPGSFLLDVKNSPTWKNVFVIVPKKGKGDDRLYWINKQSACRGFWDLKPDDVGAVAVIHVDN